MRVTCDGCMCGDCLGHERPKSGLVCVGYQVHGDNEAQSMFIKRTVPEH